MAPSQPSETRSPIGALWRNGKTTLLGTLGGKDSTALALNNHDPAGYGHYTGTDDRYTTLPGWIPSGVGFTQLQVAP